jgi:hypothetical protein
MKRHLLVVLGMLTLVFSSIAMAQTQKEVISSFEKQVEKFEKFFSSKSKVLFKESYKSSPTGHIFYYERFYPYTMSYDVRKTDSLVSPYMGYITVNYLETESTKCGNFEIKSYLKDDPERYVFTTLELARQKRDDDSCYKPFQVGGKEFKRSAKFIFAFQKKQWVYKDVVNERNEPDFVFYNAFGNPIDGRLYVQDNDFWKKLIE